MEIAMCVTIKASNEGDKCLAIYPVNYTDAYIYYTVL